MINPRGELTYFCFVTEKLFSAAHLLRDITMLKVKLEVKLEVKTPDMKKAAVRQPFV